MITKTNNNVFLVSKGWRNSVSIWYWLFCICGLYSFNYKQQLIELRCYLKYIHRVALNVKKSDDNFAQHNEQILYQRSKATDHRQPALSWWRAPFPLWGKANFSRDGLFNLIVEMVHENLVKFEWNKTVVHVLSTIASHRYFFLWDYDFFSWNKHILSYC